LRSLKDLLSPAASRHPQGTGGGPPDTPCLADDQRLFAVPGGLSVPFLSAANRKWLSLSDLHDLT
jgi:hypothetical protein